jgi:two-component system, LytTR family, response regulator LytT
MPIRTLIVEDEPLAAKRLQKMLVEIEPQIEVVDIIDTVEEAIVWFKNNPSPRLVMLDIQLADGISFDIFKQVTIDSFVVFTTAFDQYAIRAFELNSIDYLLKPIEKEKLANALQKFQRLRQSNQTIDLSGLMNSITSLQPSYKKRFVVYVGEKLNSVDAANIAYFYSMDKNTFLVTQTGEQYAIDFSLDKLESLLDPEVFFRVNRQYIVRFQAIAKMSVLSASRIKLELIPKTEEMVMVSSARTHAFRGWLDK